METLKNETLEELLNLLQIPSISLQNNANDIVKSEHKYLKDLKINVSNVLKIESLSKKEKLSLAYAVALNEKNESLSDSFRDQLKSQEVTEAELADIAACVSLLQINNVFYRFRHFTKKTTYENSPAGIKMSIMMNPVIGKELFELLSLCISALNGCEQCVVSHEHSLVNMDVSEQKIFDAIRFTSVMKGLNSLV